MVVSVPVVGLLKDEAVRAVLSQKGIRFMESVSLHYVVCNVDIPIVESV